MTLAKLSHANADPLARGRKAKRIETLLMHEVGLLSTKDILDVGTGSGLIAAHFARLAKSLLSIDAVDERTVHSFEFRLTGSEHIPATDDSFDVVLSNHVIEHVDNQCAHLLEIRRVLRPDGMCYLATPNRFCVMEPHFKLPFLSWLPQRWRNAYVRLARRGRRYDVHPLTQREVHVLANEAGLGCRDISAQMVKLVVAERFGIARMPWIGSFRNIYPSFVFLLEKPSRC